MPFGLTNAPGTFMHLMQLVLSGLQWSKAVLYLDDIITFGKTFDETLLNLELVFERLRKAGLVLKPSKCRLFQESVEFLGHVVSQEGISCDPNKLEAIKNWPKPQKVKDVRSFLGLASYYRKHIRSFATIAAPLNALTKKNAKFIFDEQCEKAFQTLKDKLCTDPIVLAYPNKEGTFVLDTDASLYGVGGVLSQLQDDGQEKVISYASRTLSKTQQNYCTTMRELLAAVAFIKHFHHYLWGRRFILRTDHASLKWLVNFKEPEGMLARWLAVLSSYDFETQHRKGAIHSNADGLSRQPPRKCKRGDCEDCALESEHCVCVITRGQAEKRRSRGQNGQSMRSASMDTSKMTQESQAPSFGGRVNLPSHSNDQAFENPPTSIVTSQDRGESPRGISKRSKGKFSNWADSYTVDQLRQAQKNDAVVLKVTELKCQSDILDKAKLCQESHEVRTLCSQWSQLELRQGILYRKWDPSNTKDKSVNQYVVPQALRQEILHQLHNHKTSGHLGVRRTLCKVRERFYWPGYKQDITRWVSKCKVCSSHKAGHMQKKAPLKQDFISAPMEKIACDIVGPLPESEKHNNYILVVSDYYTKYVEAYALPDQTAQTVADCLVTEWICRYGVPSEILSDQGRNFESILFQEMCRLLDMKKVRTSRYRPQSDGLVERYNRTLKSMLKSFTESEKSDWDEHLPYVMMAYRATIHESTKCTPNLLMFGHEVRLPVDIMYGTNKSGFVPQCPSEYVEWVRQTMADAFGKVRDSVKLSVTRQAKSYNRNTQTRSFKVGQWVWVYHLPSDKQKFGRGWKGPYLVVDKLGELNYRVQEKPESRVLTLHIDHIKSYEHETPLSWLEPKVKEVGVQTENSDKSY